NHPEKDRNCRNIPQDNYRRECLETHWTEEKLTLKISQIKRVFDQAVEHRPDIVSLVEVENENVVGQLARALGYSRWLVTESPDRRGVDVALLYNEKPYLKYLKSAEYVIQGPAF